MIYCFIKIKLIIEWYKKNFRKNYLVNENKICNKKKWASRSFSFELDDFISNLKIKYLIEIF